MSRPTRRTALTSCLLVLALAGCGGDDEGVSSAPTAEPSSTVPSSASPQPSPTGSAEAPGGSSAVAVYYVVDTDVSPRLYREFHDLPSSGEPVRDAVEAMLTVPADDPDYRSLWPTSTRVLGVEVDGETAVVDLSEEALGGSAGSAFEEASLQQLVHTVTAAEPSVRTVRLTVEGSQRETLWGAADASGDLARGPQSEVLGPVWVLTPVEGGTVARGGTVEGVATVFEATVSWEWRQGDTVVAEGFSTASTGAPERGEWSAPVDVPPGDYELRAFESSAEDGRPRFVDSKSVTVTG